MPAAPWSEVAWALASWGGIQVGDLSSPPLPPPPPGPGPVIGVGFYERLRNAVVPRLMARYKTGVVKLIKRRIIETGDPLANISTLSTYPCDAYVGGFIASEIELSAGAVQANDLRVLVGAASFPVEPQTRDSMEIDGQKLDIIAVRAVPAAGPVVLWLIQCRGGAGDFTR